MKRLRQVVLAWTVCATMASAVTTALAAPSAEYVIDARSGKVLYAQNAETKLRPASLTKMMTLYVVFDAISRGELSLDTKVTVSKNAASKPPSKLYLKAGQQIQIKYLIRASAIKSANDAAAVLAEAVSGSESAFGERMTRTARSLGMKNTTLKNPHGLDAAGHVSTAHDMTTLGRALFYHFPEYYNLFSRQSETVNGHQILNTNRRLLASYAGADGIKTGYTNGAGFNLVASAQRGNVRIIATKFGGTSGAARNARVAELLDYGFKKAPKRVATRAPRRPDLSGEPRVRVASAPVASSAKTKVEVTANAAPAAKVVTVDKSAGTRLAVASSARPTSRPAVKTAPSDAPLIPGLQASVEKSLSDVAVARAASTVTLPDPVVVAAATPIPIPRPGSPAPASAPAAPAAVAATQAASLYAAPESPQPLPRPAGITFSSSNAVASTPVAKPASVVVQRMSTSDNRNWGVTVGTFNSRYDAERALLKSALAEIETLDSAVRKVVPKASGYSADFEGMDQRTAELACQRLSARNQSCTTLAP